MSKHVKVRFHDGAGNATAGLIVSPDIARDMSAVSRLYPWSEATKMKVYQVSPPYETFEEAFRHQWDQVDAVDPKKLERERLEDLEDRARDLRDEYDDSEDVDYDPAPEDPDYDAQARYDDSIRQEFGSAAAHVWEESLYGRRPSEY